MSVDACVSKFELMSPNLHGGVQLSFSEIGSKWVDFTYERLPEFYHDCGSLKHWLPYCSRPSMDIRVGAVKPFSSTLHATLEPVGGLRFSYQRACDRSITFHDLAGSSCDGNRHQIDLFSEVVPQSADTT
ncbi:hypothetical protein GBA52_026677 [Prunus armeniaca]|nr:hypothetical protein GBA52_026677 [Prunus armeniaca]